MWWLAWTVDPFLFRRGQRHDRPAVWLAAADSAALMDDLPARTNAHRSLERGDADLGQHEDAIEQQALALAEQQADLTQQAHTRNALALAWELHGDDREALEHTRLTLDIHRRLDQRPADSGGAGRAGLGKRGWASGAGQAEPGGRD